MTGPPIVMTRQATARQHIDCAVHLLLDEAAFASANLLAWAAIEILRGVAKPKGIQTTLDLIDEHLKPGMEKEWYRHLKAHYNFAKHADQDPEKALEFSHDLVETAVFLAATDYQAIYGTLSLPMAMILHWVISRRPEILKEGVKIELAATKHLFGEKPTVEKLKSHYAAYRENRNLVERMAKEACANLEI